MICVAREKNTNLTCFKTSFIGPSLQERISIPNYISLDSLPRQLASFKISQKYVNSNKRPSNKGNSFFKAIEIFCEKRMKKEIGSISGDGEHLMNHLLDPVRLGRSLSPKRRV